MLAAVVTTFLGKELKDDPVYQERLAQGLVKKSSEGQVREIKPGAKTSVLIFLLGSDFRRLLCVGHQQQCGPDQGSRSCRATRPS